MKRIFSIALVFILLLSTFTPVMASSNYEEHGKILEGLGLLKGDEEGNLMLNDNFKRQDMVVMVSRLYGKESIAKTHKGKNLFKDLNVNRSFYIPYVAWAGEEGLVEGMGDGNFGFGRNLTVQEFQTVLLRTLGHGEDAKNWNLVPELAKTFGLMEGLDLKASANIKRGEMAAMILNALGQNIRGQGLSITLADKLKLQVPELFSVDAEATINDNSLVLKGSVKGVDTLKLHLRPTSSGITGGAKIENVDLNSKGEFTHTINNLEAGNYEYRFESGARSTQFKQITIDQVAFDFNGATANNLKEISLSFTQPVDTTSASFLSNYSTTAGSIKDIRFEDNNKTIILTLNGTMAQQGKYKVSAYRIQSVDGKQEDIKDVEFTAFDDAIPKVVDIMQLGKKGLRVVFSEPIKTPNISSFKIDNRNFQGSLKLENNVVTLTYFSSFSNLSEGEHTLNVSNIYDYANYKSTDENVPFEITKDTTPPVIQGASATLEEVIIEFNEDIDPISANKNNFYLKNRNTKIYADNVTFSNNKAHINFRNNRLSTNENEIFVENVVDYSGNKMKADSVTVKPIIDMTQPVVVNHSVSEDGKSITVYFSKNVNGKNRSNYSVKDQNNRSVHIRDIEGSGREFIVRLSSTLPIGRNTFTISGVEDTTVLKNVIEHFETYIDMSDIERPRIVSNTGYGNHIILYFSKVMDLSSVTNYDNYYINFNGGAERLPYDSEFIPGSDGKSLTIRLPETHQGRKVMIGQNLTSMTVTNLKDEANNDMDPLFETLTFNNSSTGKAKAVDYYNHTPGKQGVLIDENTIKIKFNIAIVQADIKDFSLAGRTIYNIDVDGSNEVTLYLNDSDRTAVADGDLRINANNNMKTYIETDVEGGTIYLVDEVAPRVKYGISTLSSSNGGIIELPFTEALEAVGDALYARDLEIFRSDGYLLRDSDYTTKLKYNDPSILEVKINNMDRKYEYTLRVAGANNNGPMYIRDKSGNLSLESDSYLIR